MNNDFETQATENLTKLTDSNSNVRNDQSEAEVVHSENSNIHIEIKKNDTYLKYW